MIDRIKNTVKIVLFSDATLGAVALIAIVVFAATAQADWLIQETEDNGTVATLTGVVKPGDEDVPNADTYILNSDGGYVWVGFKISSTLQKSGKPVYFGSASSIAALIALETKAQPISKEARLGFHWTYSDDGTNNESHVTEAIDTRTGKAMLDRILCKHVARIMGEMAKIHGKDQSKSIVYFYPKTSKIVTIINGKIATN